MNQMKKWQKPNSGAALAHLLQICAPKFFFAIFYLY